MILIEQKLDADLMADNPTMAKESLRARALVKEHLKKLRLSNLYYVDSLQDMLAVSIRLYRLAEARAGLEGFRRPIG